MKEANEAIIGALEHIQHTMEAVKSDLAKLGLTSLTERYGDGLRGIVATKRLLRELQPRIEKELGDAH